MHAVNPEAHYFYAIQCLMDEWNETFKDYDINDYLYTDKENAVYGMMDKFYTRIYHYRNKLPKEIKPTGLPSLRKLLNEYMHEDSDLHLSDYEFAILFPLKRIYAKKHHYVDTTQNGDFKFKKA